MKVDIFRFQECTTIVQLKCVTYTCKLPRYIYCSTAAADPAPAPESSRYCSGNFTVMPVLDDAEDSPPPAAAAAAAAVLSVAMAPSSILLYRSMMMTLTRFKNT